MTSKALGPFPHGIDNRRHPSDLHITYERKEIALLAAAVNVDLADGGKLRRRDGVTKLLDGPNYHSLWGDGGSVGYAVNGTELLALRADGETSVVRTGMTPRMPVSFARRAGLVFFTDGIRLEAIDGDQIVPQTPRLPFIPGVAAGSDGGMPEGRYQVAFTLTGRLGESAATEPVAVDVAAGGVIQVSGLYEPPGFTLTAYITGPNGNVFSAVDMVRFEDKARIALQSDYGAYAQTIGLVPMPAGEIVRSHDARLLVARGSYLFYSELFAPMLMNPVSGFIEFEAPITVVRPCGSGVYVCADKTYWLPGDMAQTELREVLPYGGLRGSDCSDASSRETMFWMSDRGLVRGREDGQVVNVQAERLSMAGGERAATYLRERNGQSHVIAATQSPVVSRGAVYASMGVEIVRGTP